MRYACTGPAPPNANSGNFSMSLPRSTAWMRAADAMFSLTELVDAPGGAHQVQAERPADARLDRRAPPRAVEPHRAAEEEVRIEVAEHQVGVGHGRLGAALAVAGRPGLGAGAVRPDLERPRPSIRAMLPPPAPISIISITGTLTGRPLPFLKRYLRSTSNCGAISGSPSLDQAGLGGGAAHVEREQARAVDQPAVVRRRERARGRAGLDQAHGKPARGLDVAHAAVRLHDEQVAGDAERAQRVLESLQIALGEALHVDVGERGRGALVLADLGHHLAGQRAGDLRRVRAQQLADRPLVRRIAVAVQQADRDRLDALGAQGLDQAQHLVRCRAASARCRRTARARRARSAGGAAPAASAAP